MHVILQKPLVDVSLYFMCVIIGHASTDVGHLVVHFHYYFFAVIFKLASHYSLVFL